MSKSLDMADQAIDHLLNVLNSRKTPLSPTISNNLVYYIPRVKSVPKLTRLINATFQETSRPDSDVIELFEMAQAIAQWKLQISEPIISPAQFFKIWDSCFVACQLWTGPKLAILAGILSTRDSFISIQSDNFIDETGHIGKLYDKWEQSIFIPTWCALLKHFKKDPGELILLYSAISKPSDGAKYLYLPWDLITLCLSHMFSDFMVGLAHCPQFFAKHLSQMAKTLQTSLANGSITSVNNFLTQVCRSSYNMNFKELNSLAAEKDYSSKYYSGILFTIVISINSILQTVPEIPIIWYSQVLMTLLNINFIATDVGVVGFDSYESVYEILCSGITMTVEPDTYYSVARTMRDNVWVNQSYQNKVNKSKLLFLLNFLGSTLSHVSMISSNFISTFIEPLDKMYVTSAEEEIRESVHVMMLSLFANNSSANNLLHWQARHYLDHIELSTDQFMLGNISEKQLTMIYQEMSSRLPSLQVIDRHLAREVLHRTYLRILNCSSDERTKQAVLLKCIVYQLPYLSENHFVGWLDTVQEILSSIPFNKEECDDILTTLWNVLSHRRSDTALKWWYGHLDTLRSRL